jgi:hypothetical protein
LMRLNGEWKNPGTNFLFWKNYPETDVSKRVHGLFYQDYFL